MMDKEKLMQEYACFEGRLNRKPYIIRSIILSLVVGVICGILYMIPVVKYLAYVVYLGGLYCSVSLGVRRLHDLGRPGWWFIGLFIPLAGLALAIYMLFFRGTEGPNEYGNDPLA